MTARRKPTICSLNSLRSDRISDATSARSECISDLSSLLAGQFGAQICAQRLEVGLGRELRAHLAQKLEDQAFGLGRHCPILTASRARVRADRPFTSAVYSTT